MVVDDALMGVTEVVRGNDLLLSTAQQLYLYRLLGLPAPRYAHLPLICNENGVRLSKRDTSMSAGELRRRYSAAEITGIIAGLAGLRPDTSPCTPQELLECSTGQKFRPSRASAVMSFNDLHITLTY